MKLMIDLMAALVVLAPLAGVVAWLIVYGPGDSERHVAFEVKLEVPEDGCDDGSPTGGISPRRVHGRRHGRRHVRRRKVGQGEVSHYAKMHSRTRYHL